MPVPTLGTSIPKARPPNPPNEPVRSVSLAVWVFATQKWLLATLPLPPQKLLPARPPPLLPGWEPESDLRNFATFSDNVRQVNSLPVTWESSSRLPSPMFCVRRDTVWPWRVRALCIARGGRVPLRMSGVVWPRGSASAHKAQVPVPSLPHLRHSQTNPPMVNLSLECRSRQKTGAQLTFIPRTRMVPLERRNPSFHLFLSGTVLSQNQWRRSHTVDLYHELSLPGGSASCQSFAANAMFRIRRA